jgi:hypothetical protein
MEVRYLFLVDETRSRTIVSAISSSIRLFLRASIEFSLNRAPGNDTRDCSKKQHSTERASFGEKAISRTGKPAVLKFLIERAETRPAHRAHPVDVQPLTAR